MASEDSGCAGTQSFLLIFCTGRIVTERAPRATSTAGYTRRSSKQPDFQPQGYPWARQLFPTLGPL